MRSVLRLPTVRIMPTLGAVFPRNVRAERVRRDLTQDDLGERLGWSRSKVADLETGRTTLRADDLAPICRALGVTLARLAEGADAEDLQSLGL